MKRRRGSFFGAVILEEIKDNTRNGRKLEGWEKERVVFRRLGAEIGKDWRWRKDLGLKS